jgi:RNA recognition motif-containing protein
MSTKSACHTLLVGNLNDSVHVKDLKSLLYEAFASYGDVIDVHVAKGSAKDGRPFRGLAFVSFKTMTQATSALRNMQKFQLLGKEIRIEYAKKQSDSVLKMAGKFRAKKRKVRQADDMDDQ